MSFNFFCTRPMFIFISVHFFIFIYFYFSSSFYSFFFRLFVFFRLFIHYFFIKYYFVITQVYFLKSTIEMIVNILIYLWKCFICLCVLIYILFIFVFKFFNDIMYGEIMFLIIWSTFIVKFFIIIISLYEIDKVN